MSSAGVTASAAVAPATGSVHEISSPLGREMFSFLPGYYENSRVMSSDINAKGAELDELYRALNETLDQFFVRTATWGLDRWEQELGLATDREKPLEQRRALVESKLRGAGQFSGRLVKNVAEAYDGGTVDVTFAPSEWSFTIKFIDTIGIPPNLDDLRAMIEEIKPAHLAVEYEFSYLVIKELHGVKTLSEMQQLPLSKFAGGGSLGQQNA
ncbi:MULTISPECIES: YmfQ family protein [Paenibacillus]|uniref:YmfQ family protein n=1 Tax=Paenibacillus TaxID=44249 RepID=UPI002FDF23A1